MSQHLGNCVLGVEVLEQDEAQVGGRRDGICREEGDREFEASIGPAVEALVE
jgi:hypothetical protein